MEQSPFGEGKSFQLVKKFPTFYRNQRFIIAFTTARHLSLSWFSSMKYVKSVPLLSWRDPEGSRKLRLQDFVTTAQDGGKAAQPYAPAAFTPR